MARQYAPLHCEIWIGSGDFVKLSGGAQRLYLLAMSQPNISWCGVVPYTERRWAALSSDATPAKIGKACAELVKAGFVVLDEATEELWVRSFVKYNATAQPKLRNAAIREFREVHSPKIRAAAVAKYPWLAPKDDHDDAQPDGHSDGHTDAHSEDGPELRVDVGVGAQGSRSTATSTPTPTDDFAEGCHLAAREQCEAWVARGSTITNQLGWIATRARNLMVERADLLDRAVPNDTVTADEWRCLIQTGRFSEDNARTHPLGCDECSGGWIYTDDANEVHPCPSCAGVSA